MSNKKLEKFKRHNSLKKDNEIKDTSMIIKNSTNELPVQNKLNITNELTRGVKYKGRKITRLK